MHLSPGRAIHHLLQDYHHTQASGVTVLSVMLPCKSCRVRDVKQLPCLPLQSLHRHIKPNNLADTACRSVMKAVSSDPSRRRIMKSVPLRPRTNYRRRRTQSPRRMHFAEAMNTQILSRSKDDPRLLRACQS
jgi:hypothetical protein